MKWRDRYVQALSAGLAAGLTIVLMGIVWNAAWETRPAGTELASDIDIFIQEFKDEVGDRGSVETVYGVGSNDNGLLRLGAARCFIQAAAPTDMVGPGAYNSTAGAFVSTLLGTNEPGGTIDVGTARCWIDTDGLSTLTTLDDNQLNVWVDTVGWTPVTAVGTGNLQIGDNLIYNGSFEVTDGTGSAASTTVPQGWALLVTPTIAYDDPTAVTEGEGIALETIGAGAAFEGVQQTLTALKSDTDYVIRARARPVTAGDSCRLQVTGGDSTQTDTSVVAGNVFETLEVVVNTTAVPAALVVTLAAVADTDECDWDHVTAYEQDAVVDLPGNQFCHDTDNSTATTYAVGMTGVPGLLCAVTIPSPGYAIRVDAKVIGDNESGGTPGSMEVELREDCGGGATPVTGGTAQTANTTDAGSGLDVATVVLTWVNVLPTPGTTCQYDLRAASVQGDMRSNDFDNSNVSATRHLSSLDVQLIPTR